MIAGFEFLLGLFFIDPNSVGPGNGQREGMRVTPTSASNWSPIYWGSSQTQECVLLCRCELGEFGSNSAFV
jgi:hypothetical protein